MIIKDCFKDYNDKAISKVVPPEVTCRRVLKKLNNLAPSILAYYIELRTQLDIPQIRVVGTDDYQAFARSMGQNGKGHSRTQALASGLMELVERYSCGKYLKNGISLVSSFKNLELKGNPFRLEDILKYPRLTERKAKKELETAKISWYRGYTLEEEEVYIPMNLIRYLLEGSNGMASGNSFEEALLHGICEVIERHFIALIEERKIKTPFIDKTTVNLPAARYLINKAEVLGQKIYIKDFSLGFGMPVIGVIRKTTRDTCTITVGVATDRDEALTRALTENSQVQGNAEATRKISLSGYHFLRNKSISMQDIPNIADSNIRLEIERIKVLLRKQEMRAFFVIATDKILNIPCVYVYIPQCKFSFPRIEYRNIWMGLVLESLVVKDNAATRKYINKAGQNDKANQAIYSFYRGIYLRQQLRYSEAIRSFLNAGKAINRMTHLEPVERVEIRSFAIANLVLCYQATGNTGKVIGYLLNLSEINPCFSFKQLRSYFSAGLAAKERKLFDKVFDLYQNVRALRGKIALKKAGSSLKVHKYLGTR
ncbi:hypothetical protein EPN54_02015 [bacterium]|nr:MAG: hypothetical protein EPN54_02015 [bacterium]